MPVTKTLLSASLLALTAHAGIAQAGTNVNPAANSVVVPLAAASEAVARVVHLLNQYPAGKGAPERHVSPRGMAVCRDYSSQPLCRAGLSNGDFEDSNAMDPHDGWSLTAGSGSLAPYLGSTPDSRVLALPGKGATAVSPVVLPYGSTGPGGPHHRYTVKLRARGSGPQPAGLAVVLAGARHGDAESLRELASTTRHVGWDWADMTFHVDGIMSAEPAVLLVAIERTDGNVATLLQVDDVRIERTPLPVNPNERGSQTEAP